MTYKPPRTAVVNADERFPSLRDGVGDLTQFSSVGTASAFTYAASTIN